MVSFLDCYQRLVIYAIKWIAILLAVVFGLIFVVIVSNFIFGFHWGYPWWSPVFTLTGLLVSFAIMRVTTGVLRSQPKEKE